MKMAPLLRESLFDMEQYDHIMKLMLELKNMLLLDDY